MLRAMWHPGCLAPGMKLISRHAPLFSLVAALGLLSQGPRCAAAERIPIKVIVLAGFEVGDDTGDAPGEFQFWVEREKLTDRIDVPGAPHPLCRNAAGLYGDVGGNTRDPQLTPVSTSELVMALCLDPRFDLSHTYWIVDGIAGIDPAVGSIGSAVWAENVVDGDALREIDEAEAPAAWPYGLFAIGTDAPGKVPGVEGKNGGWGGAKLEYTMNYPLNKKLAHWAYETSKGVELADSPALKAWRGKYAAYPQALLPPHVMMGDALGTVRYWHGPKRTQWARDWVKEWTQGSGTFATTSMEAQDYLGTLTRMAAKGFLDINRVMVMRTASNYCMPPPGQDATTTIGDESLGTNASLEAAYRTGAAVAHELLANWPKYEKATPGE
jgi:purine nucleoside permease